MDMVLDMRQFDDEGGLSDGLEYTKEEVEAIEIGRI